MSFYYNIRISKEAQIAKILEGIPKMKIFIKY